MARSLKRKAQMNKVAGASIARLIRFVGRTSPLVTDPPDALERVYSKHPSIIACWHGQFMMAPHFHRAQFPVAAMVARHGDAELIGHALREFGIELIRGAGAGGRKKDRGGAHAFRAAMSAFENGKSLVMTADVPPGPARRAGAGIIKLAMLSGRPIVPVATATSRYQAFKTWSRMTVNLPYSKFAMTAGPHIFVPRDADDSQLEAARLELESALNALTLKAYEMAGADPTRATPPDHAKGIGAPPPGIGLKTYRLATRALEPVAPLILRTRESQGKEDASRRGERLGMAPVSRPDGLVAWFHAASVGETNAILPVIDALARVRPDLRFLLTTGTVTSASIAQARLPNSAIHQFAPLDGPTVVSKFLDHWRPDLAVFTESDVWPNLILEASARKIPLVLVNARMSDRSFARWRRNKGLSAPLFGRFDAILAQEEKFVRRFQKIGGRVVESVGNLKIDAPAPNVDPNSLKDLTGALRGRPSWVAASTHEGEEEIIGEAQRLLSRRIDDCILLLAPRHPERGTHIAEQLKGAGLSVIQRSSRHLPTPACDVYVVDTLGELGMLYAASPVAFIGGSLVDKGGQNPIEAVSLETAVVSGPHRTNFREIYQTLERYGGVADITSAADLADTVEQILRDEQRADTMKLGAQQAILGLSGALDKTVATLLRFIPQPDGNYDQSDSRRESGRASG